MEHPNQPPPAKLQGLPKGILLIGGICLASVLSIVHGSITSSQFLTSFSQSSEIEGVALLGSEKTSSNINANLPFHQSSPALQTKTSTDNSKVVQQAEPNLPPAASSPAEAPLVTLTEKESEEQIAKLRLQTSIQPFSNATTCAWGGGGFYAGFRNQMMAFTALIMAAKEVHGCEQLLVARFLHKDTFGSNQKIPHADLFDLEHWNTYWPDLPRMVSCDPDIHTDYDCSTGSWIGGEGPTSWNATHPVNLSWKTYAPHRLMGRYRGYSKGKGQFSKPNFPNKVDLLMMKGASRPSPDLQKIIDNMISRLDGSDHGSTNTNGNHSTSGNTSTTIITPYMTLHARVEPEMIRHFACPQFKETNLTKIFQMVQATFPEPPATKMFIPINRQNMEKEGQPHLQNPNPNPLFVENLAALNRAVLHGLWGGRVQVFEFGSNALKGTKFEHRPSTIGAMLNYYIALGGNVFIGTEISSYSTDLLSTRFYRGNRENYKYLPGGLEKWPADDATRPPGFHC
jgi:hypothetical protein